LSSKKEEIICKVSALIHARGYSNTKLSDILKETGIGKGQFYHYFSSKQDLSEAVIDYLIAEMEQALFENIFNKEGSPKTKLNDMLETIYSMQIESAGKHGCPIGNLAVELTEEEAMFREKISDFFDHWEQRVKELLDEMQQAGELKNNVNTLKGARSIIAMIEGAILRSKNCHDLQVFRDVIDVMKEQYQLLEDGENKEKNAIYLL
jgi:TetR/AcrR family transcriptional regulator, transcriptional repressor for nem operon